MKTFSWKKGYVMTQKSTREKKIRTTSQDLLRAIPKVDDCLEWLATVHDIPDRLKKDAIREYLEEMRQGILSGLITDDGLLAQVHVKTAISLRAAAKARPRLRRVINATGVVVHTNLGRSLLPPEAVRALVEAAVNYSNLEMDLPTGKRGSRYSLVEELLVTLTGAEAALVVNNNAAAVLLVLETLAKEKEVVVSRGQLVEIGGSFRIPDVMARSGARLVEVGATNRTHLRDYENVLTEATGLLLKVHTSNFRVIGFTSEVSMKDLVQLGKRRNVPVMEDLGSGCLVDLSRFGLRHEPTVQESIAAGADVVTFSGDKLLGGPQAGIIAGRREIIDRVKRNPLNRALRIDKFTLASLEAVLRLYLDDEENAIERVPTLSMLAVPQTTLQRRAGKLVRTLARVLPESWEVSVVHVQSRVGGGAMPEEGLPSRALAIRPDVQLVNAVERRLRAGETPVICRIEDEQLLFDLRTVRDDEMPLLTAAIVNACRLEAGV